MGLFQDFIINAFILYAIKTSKHCRCCRCWIKKCLHFDFTSIVLNLAEVKQVVNLLPRWVTIDVDDALLLLSDDFKNESVRSLGVSMLDRSDDDELQVHCLSL